MKIKKELIKRQIAGDTILVPVGKTVYDSNGLFVLNELAAFIWNLLPQAKNEADIVSAVLDEYKIDELTAKNDVAEFLGKLKEAELIA